MRPNVLISTGPRSYGQAQATRSSQSQSAGIEYLYFCHPKTASRLVTRSEHAFSNSLTSAYHDTAAASMKGSLDFDLLAKSEHSAVKHLLNILSALPCNMDARILSHYQASCLSTLVSGPRLRGSRIAECQSIRYQDNSRSPPLQQQYDARMCFRDCYSTARAIRAYRIRGCIQVGASLLVCLQRWYLVFRLITLSGRQRTDIVLCMPIGRTACGLRGRAGWSGME